MGSIQQGWLLMFTTAPKRGNNYVCESLFVTFTYKYIPQLLCICNCINMLQKLIEVLPSSLGTLLSVCNHVGEHMP